MKLEVGMYVRIKNEAGWCCIGKIENINEFREPSIRYCVDIQDIDFIFIPEDMIVKASYNIIDLIEVGDYVNGEKVTRIRPPYILGDEELDCVHISSLNGEEVFEDIEIKSIVTKEQFESMSYKVGE